jgi:peptidoglycan/LPS O-acetylase OafA/YrhL
MTTPIPTKLSNIQSLRGFAAMLVVLSHLPIMETKYSGDQLLPRFTGLGISGVDLFFVISGFIMVYVTWNSDRSIKNTSKFLFARVTRIFPIYWVIAGLVYFVWLFSPSLINFDPGKTGLIKSFLLWPDQTYPMLKVAWTLIHELYFYIVFAHVLLLPRTWRIPALTLWVICVAMGEMGGLRKISPETALIFHPLSIEFFLGAVAGWVFMMTDRIAGGAMLIVGITLFTISHFILGAGFDISVQATIPTHWERVFYFGIPSTMIVFGLARLEKRRRLPKWSVNLGNWSYSLYLSHVLTLSVIGYVWKQFAQPGPIDNIIMLIVMIAASILVSSIFWFTFEKPALGFFRKIRTRMFPSPSKTNN